MIQFSQDPAGGALVDNPWDMLMALGVSFFCSLILAYIYRQSHRGLSYSVSFVHAMIIMAVTVTVIMMIIGSNIARAFSLVGALSIIRFRTAIKDPRDVAFLFMTMAVGMACGTGYWWIGVGFTLFAIPMVLFLHKLQIGAMPTSEMLFKAQVPEGSDHTKMFAEVFYKFTSENSLLSIETIQGGTRLELVYSILAKPGVKEGELLEELRKAAGGGKVALIVGQQNVNV
ncbi:MAG TPA: DUF4956 domain-containing protein [Planctomycetota bacterium]|nr:DUF4956 domain-containing protein [Planctomycetota bacterium]